MAAAEDDEHDDKIEAVRPCASIRPSSSSSSLFTGRVPSSSSASSSLSLRARHCCDDGDDEIRGGDVLVTHDSSCP